MGRFRKSWLGRTQFPRSIDLRGIPDDLMTLCLSNLLIVEPATGVADYEPWPLSILKRPKTGRLNIGWGARIRTMIKRTKISCPTIRRHPNCVNDYKHLFINCNNIFYYKSIACKFFFSFFTILCLK